MAKIGTFAGVKELDYDVSDAVLKASREGVLRQFYKWHYKFRIADDGEPIREVSRKKMAVLRRIVKDINVILKRRGHKRMTQTDWRSKVKEAA